MKSVLVVGMGRFGRHLAGKMIELGNEVMVVDQDENIIQDLPNIYTDSHIGDCTNENVVRSLGVNNFDICFVTIGENFQSSLVITSLLKKCGAKYVCTKASQDIQAEFLMKIGADEVVYPERDRREARYPPQRKEHLRLYTAYQRVFAVRDSDNPVVGGADGCRRQCA